MTRGLLCLGPDPARRQAGAALSRFLSGQDRLKFDLAPTGDLPANVADYEVVISAGSDAAGSGTLVEYVQQGGKLVAFCGGDPAWLHPPARTLLGLPAEALRPTRETELSLRPATDHPITQRLEGSFPLTAPATLFEAAPDDAAPLLETSWQLRRPVVAYTRRCGAGAVVIVGLAPTPGVLSEPTIQRFVFRAARHLTATAATQPVRVAMIGYGAIGREHAEAVHQVAGLELAVVCDRNPAQRSSVEREFPEVRTCPDLNDVLDDAGVDLAIVSTPPNTHAGVAAQLLRAGKHVVVEKPFCLTTHEADLLISLAERERRVLTVYQNRRWDADFVAIQRAAETGSIGDLFHLESFVGGFGHPCDYWHSHEEVSGGVFYDWGSHYIDWILNLVPGRVVGVRASTHKRVWHDVTNADQARIALRFESGAEAEFIHSDIAVALKPKWYILGTRGAVVADWRFESIKTRRWSGDLIEEPLAAADALPLVTVHTREPSGAVHVQRLGLVPPPLHPFHRNLADHLQAGEGLAVTAESARRNIAVMEAATESARRGADAISVDV